MNERLQQPADQDGQLSIALGNLFCFMSVLMAFGGFFLTAMAFKEGDGRVGIFAFVISAQLVITGVVVRLLIKFLALSINQLEARECGTTPEPVITRNTSNRYIPPSNVQREFHPQVNSPIQAFEIEEDDDELFDMDSLNKHLEQFKKSTT